MDDVMDAQAEADQAEPGADEYEMWEIVRVTCPECDKPLAMFADEDVLPPHARLATRWDPFGLSVCAGAGRPAMIPGAVAPLEVEDDVAALLTLPQGLDWRTQPFSHLGGPGSHPVPRPLRLTA